MTLLSLSAPLIALYLFLRINAVGVLTIPLNSPIARLTLHERLLNMPAIISFYIINFTFPLNLASSYHWVIKQTNFKSFFLPLAIDLLLLSTILYCGYIIYKDKRKGFLNTYIIFCAWFVLGILIHLQFSPLDATVADRWFYFPFVGVLGIIGVLLEAFHFNVIKRSKIIIVLTLAVLILLSGRTIIRSFDWRDDSKLATHDLEVSPDSYALESLLAKTFIIDGRYQEAKAHAQRSIELYPYISNYINLGVIYTRLGDYQNAKEVYFEALKLGDYYLIYEHLGGLYVVYGDPNENIKFVKFALQKYPQNAKLWLYLAILNYKVGNISQAKTQVTRAYSFSQDDVITYFYKKITNNQMLDFNY